MIDAPSIEDVPHKPPRLHVETWSRPEPIWDVIGRAVARLRGGEQVVLVVDPELRMVGVFRLNELPQRFSNGDVLTLHDVLSGFAVPANKFFG